MLEDNKNSFNRGDKNVMMVCVCVCVCFFSLFVHDLLNSIQMLQVHIWNVETNTSSVYQLTCSETV